ncbi:hypothetical protein BFJ66_g47 [Fusarium oxysporum f. sp. cepae]|nr:hypothetical protein BFJ65_g4934 [Fusarium oxysporum f. sp. cepae]RKK53456.1 hypothetical protein BFJ67_g5091 [Fusarium oxysporum f. sp. cepae]RKK64153.1 hypothetical protein BFJ66_g47 [Fusarium oxysporum f. sp. cepae]RKK90577.1 hypothetical protein BFJ71_g11467 [Fusarium oxysporum]
MALHASNLTTANPQRGLMVKNELESWTVEYDGLINEHQCKEYEWVGLRSKSPPFRPETFVPGTDSKTAIDIMTKGFLTVPNAETRLVVKVFIPKHLVSLDSMKAIASMLWLVDPLLSDIHPAHWTMPMISRLRCCPQSRLRTLGIIAFRLNGNYWSFYPTQETWGKRSIAIGFTEFWVLPPSKI